jgi:hypothetical protein
MSQDVVVQLADTEPYLTMQVVPYIPLAMIANERCVLKTKALSIIKVEPRSIALVGFTGFKRVMRYWPLDTTTRFEMLRGNLALRFSRFGGLLQPIVHSTCDDDIEKLEMFAREANIVLNIPKMMA